MAPTLLDSMTQSVTQQCDAKLSAAREEADAIVADAKARADQAYQEGLERAKRQIELDDKRALDLAEAEGDKLVLSGQHQVVEDVLWSVAEKLKNMAGQDDFGNIVEALLAQAVNAAHGDIVVISPPGHVDRGKQWLEQNGRGDVSVEGSDELYDGVAVQDKQKSYRITNTLSSRYEKFEPQARKIIMQKLFGGESAS